jgi:hypothetical protein
MWRPSAGVFAGLAVLLAFLLPGSPVLAQGSEGDIVPDVALVVTPVPDEDRERLLDGLNRIEGVSRATADTTGDGTAVFYIARSQANGGRPVTAVTGDASGVILDRIPDAEILVGGSSQVDRALAGPFSTSVIGVALVALIIGAALGAVFGWKRAAALAVSLFIAVICAASIGTQVGGEFDGTITSTALPGALAGLVAATAVALRLSLWFRAAADVSGGRSGPASGHANGSQQGGVGVTPETPRVIPRASDAPQDGAAIMRRSVTELLPELALMFSGLLLATMVVELLNAGRSPLTVVTISAAVAVLVVLALLAPALTLLLSEPEARRHWLPLTFTDGRDFPLLVLSAIALVLLALSLFAFRTPNPSLMDSAQLDEGVEAAIVAERLSTGGDATSAVVASAPADGTAQEFQAWIAAVAERPEVAWVDTSEMRLRATGPVEIDQANLLVPAGDSRAVIVLNASPRSQEGQQAVADLAAIPMTGGPPVLEGAAIDAAGVAGARGPVVVAVLALAVVAALALYVLTQNIAHAIIAFVLRLIGGGATLGVFRLMDGDATMAESLTVLALLALGLGLFELEFLRSPMDRIGTGFRDRAYPEGLVSPDSGSNPGQYAAIAIAALGGAAFLVSILAVAGGGAGTGQFGLGLLVAVIIELLVGVVLLRPSLLGQRAAFHTAARPVRIALHSGGERQTSSGLGAEDPMWRRAVSDLLQSEFRFQSEPSTADLETVFVRDTPLYRQADAHHQNLAQANLRIVGRSPQLRSLKTVSGRSPITLAVTVDHPIRHLVDANGNVVGVRKPERRSGVLWLAAENDGSYRITESVELGSVMLQAEQEPSNPDAEPPAPTPLRTAEQPLSP